MRRVVHKPSRALIFRRTSSLSGTSGVTSFQVHCFPRFPAAYFPTRFLVSFVYWWSATHGRNENVVAGRPLLKLVVWGCRVPQNRRGAVSRPAGCGESVQSTAGLATQWAWTFI